MLFNVFFKNAAKSIAMSLINEDALNDDVRIKCKKERKSFLARHLKYNLKKAVFTIECSLFFTTIESINAQHHGFVREKNSYSQHQPPWEHVNDLSIYISSLIWYRICGIWNAFHSRAYLATYKLILFTDTTFYKIIYCLPKLIFC